MGLNHFRFAFGALDLALRHGWLGARIIRSSVQFETWTTGLLFIVGAFREMGG